jgi:hypothetical protein
LEQCTKKILSLVNLKHTKPPGSVVNTLCNYTNSCEVDNCNLDWVTGYPKWRFLQISSVSPRVYRVMAHKWAVTVFLQKLLDTTFHNHIHTIYLSHKEIAVFLKRVKECRSFRASDRNKGINIRENQFYWRRAPALQSTPSSKFNLKKLTVTQLVKKFPAVYGIRRFITPWSRSWVIWIQPTSFNPNSSRFIIILHSYICTNCFLRSDSPTKMLHNHSSHVAMSVPSHHRWFVHRKNI